MLLMAAEGGGRPGPRDSLPDLRGAGNRGTEKPLALTSARRQSGWLPGVLGFRARRRAPRHSAVPA